jgi:hypothetical protein
VFVSISFFFKSQMMLSICNKEFVLLWLVNGDNGFCFFKSSIRTSAEIRV